MTIPTYERRKLLLDIQGISLSYQGVPVLKNVNGRIYDLHEDKQTRGQVLGILGPSGVGKTQLFKILCNMQRTNYDGEVLIGETQHPVRRGEVGVVAQSYPLFEHRTVLGNMLVAVPPKHHARRMEMALAMLKTFDLEGKGHLYHNQLSGGQRQRAATAQQMLCSDHFLLMDEPFSGQDVLRVNKVCQFILEVANRDTLNTLILVSQTIAPIVAVADTIWLLGRDRDAQGNIIPGAYIKKEFNLIERGLAWQPDVKKLPGFSPMVREIEDEFNNL